VALHVLLFRLTFLSSLLPDITPFLAEDAMFALHTYCMVRKHFGVFFFSFFFLGDFYIKKNADRLSPRKRTRGLPSLIVVLGNNPALFWYHETSAFIFAIGVSLCV
jgi:hypothetical protein